MPKLPRPGIRPVYVELDQNLANRLEALAEGNHRTLKAEITIALEKHVAEGEAVCPVQEDATIVAGRHADTVRPELPTTRGRYLILVGEPILSDGPRWAHFSWRGDSFCVRDFLRGRILRDDRTIKAADVWRAALRRKPANGDYFRRVGDWEWWRGKLEELSQQETAEIPADPPRSD